MFIPFIWFIIIFFHLFIDQRDLFYQHYFYFFTSTYFVGIVFHISVIYSSPIFFLFLVSLFVNYLSARKPIKPLRRKQLDEMKQFWEQLRTLKKLESRRQKITIDVVVKYLKIVVKVKAGSWKTLP